MKESKIFFADRDQEAFRKELLDSAYSSIHILCDSNTYQDCFTYFKEWSELDSAKLMIIPAGENSKNLEIVEDICKQFIQVGIERNSLCVAIGGGVVCDILGFCSSILLRGVDCIYIPTSLMAMADAAIGGKTGINFLGGKNLLGSFHTPRAIYINYQFLHTLDKRNLKNGFVEMIKHSLLQGEKEFNKILKINVNNINEALFNQIESSIQFKLDTVRLDPLDKGLRNSLNLGHTLGHAIESHLLSKNIEILHGEAIALGLILELKLAGYLFHKDIKYFNSAIQQLSEYKFDYQFHEEDLQSIVEILLLDKKKQAEQMNFTLLSELGKFEINQKIDKELLVRVLSKNLL